MIIEELKSLNDRQEFMSESHFAKKKKKSTSQKRYGKQNRKELLMKVWILIG